MTFQEAIDLITERCPSVVLALRGGPGRPASSFTQKHYPFGLYVPEYISIEQNKPSPMPPLRAWKGYLGNVYFEPIKVNRVPFKVESSADYPAEPEVAKCSEKLQDILRTSSRHSPSRVSGLSGSCDFRTRSPVRSRTQSSVSRRTSGSVAAGGRRQMSILDKATVLDQQNDQIREDLIWIAGQESTGSLRFDYTTRTNDSFPKRNMEKIRRSQSGKPDMVWAGSQRGNAGRSETYSVLSLRGGTFSQLGTRPPTVASRTVLPPGGERIAHNTRNPTPECPHYQDVERLPPLHQ